MLYQVPGLLLLILGLSVLQPTFGYSFRVAAAIVAGWLLKDLLLFPFLRGAYEADGRSVVERLVGERAMTVQELAPAGYVRVRGELWRAEARAGADPIPAGQPVVVDDVRGFTLMVSPSAPREIRVS
jgi:membrane protein implicated in regulation of membrane protease activity